MKRLFLACVLFAAVVRAQSTTDTQLNQSGSITASSTTCSGTGCVYLTAPWSAVSATVQITGTFSATLQYELSVDNVNWSAASSTSGATSTTTTGTATFALNGARFFRVRCSAYTSGTAAVAITASLSGTVNVTGGGSGSGVSYCAPASASGTTYTCTPSPALTSYAAGSSLSFVPDVNGSGGATTVNANGLGAKSIKLADGSTNPASTDIVAGKSYLLVYDGTVFRLGPEISASAIVQLPTSGLLKGAAGPTFATAAKGTDYALGTVATNATASGAITLTCTDSVMTFNLTLTGNVTGTTMASCATGSVVIFNILQGAGGPWTFAAPTNTTGFGGCAGAIFTTGTSHQVFWYDGTNFQANSPMTGTGQAAGSVLTLCGSTSGSSLLEAPVTGGGTNLLPPGNGTLAINPTLFSSSGSSAAVTGTSAATLIGSIVAGGAQSIPAGISAGTALDWKLGGVFTTAGYAGTITITVLVNGVAQITSSTLTPVSGTAAPWSAQCQTVVMTTGVSGTATLSCSVFGLTTAVTVLESSTAFAINTTQANPLDFQAAWSTVTGSPSIQGDLAYVELPPAAPPRVAKANGYSYQGTFTVDHTKLGGANQTNLPVLISFTDATFKTTANGGGIQHTVTCGANSITWPADFIATSDSGGQNIIPMDCVAYSATTGKVQARINVPSLSASADTSFYVWYGNSSISSLQFTASSAYDSNFIGVYHLETIASPNDSSVSANNATNHSATNLATTSYLGNGAQYVSASSQYVVTGNVPLGTSQAITLSMWVNKAFSTDTGSAGPVAELSTSLNTHTDAMYIFYGDSGTCGGTGRLSVAVKGNVGVNLSCFNAPSDNTWTQIVAVCDKSLTNPQCSFYINGAAATSQGQGGNTSVNTNTFSSSEPFYFASRGGSTNFINLKQDEVMISNVNRSLTTGWITSMYNSENNPTAGGFFSAVTLDQ